MKALAKLYRPLEKGERLKFVGSYLCDTNKESSRTSLTKFIENGINSEFLIVIVPYGKDNETTQNLIAQPKERQ